MSQTAELQRRVLLAESDILLDDVEALRLLDLVEAPPRLREAIRALQIRLGRRNPPLPSETLDAAHELVFAVQQRLMAANPRNPRPLRHVGRPSGQPMFTIVRASYPSVRSPSRIAHAMIRSTKSTRLYRTRSRTASRNVFLAIEIIRFKRGESNLENLKGENRRMPIR